ncbi:MAG: hypothetical protein EOP49_25405, partial [Sphingobacteriales bacterium]
MKAKQNKNRPAAPIAATPEKAFHIPYPGIWLAAIVMLLYYPVFQFGFTELDDTIFIRELYMYNDDLGNLVISFTRGVFNAENDTYYRPLFLDAMILNYQVSGKEIAGYHVVNVLIHLACVLMLYRLLRHLTFDAVTAFLLSLIFAVHPVLTQAVAWIPGRNDTLLALFTLPYLIYSLKYHKQGNPIHLIAGAIFLIAAMFTKETGLLAPAAAWLLLVVGMRYSWKDKKMIILYAAWVAAAALYFLVRSGATLKSNNLQAFQMAEDFVSRLPLLIQYLGKILLPFNLSVFPIMENTVYYYGLAALVLLTVGLVLARDRNKWLIAAGLGIYFVLLLPALVVPKGLNEQTFEHRLYLPIIGILILLSQTILFRNRLKPRNLTAAVGALVVLFAVLNRNHQQYFRDPLSFWSQAVETSPNSAYALMMYGARVEEHRHQILEHGAAPTHQCGA